MAHAIVTNVDVFVYVALCITVYLLPSIIAHGRGNPNAFSISILNLALGWTGLGWIAALIWSCMGKPTQH